MHPLPEFVYVVEGERLERRALRLVEVEGREQVYSLFAEPITMGLLAEEEWLTARFFSDINLIRHMSPLQGPQQVNRDNPRANVPDEPILLTVYDELNKCGK